MIEKITYINHINESISFGVADIFANENTMHDFEWAVTSKNNNISSLSKKITKKTMPVIIKCNTDEEGIAVRNRLFEVTEKDVLALKHGRLIIGDYYLKCFVTACKYSKYSLTKQYAKITLTIQTDYPMWVKENVTNFNYGLGNVGKNLDYNNDYDYDYTSNMLGKQLNNTDFVASNFIIRVYGVAENPAITVGGHKYSVGVSVAKNEYLTIDSIKKTVILTKQDGQEVNCFNLRSRDSYIFEKMQAGILRVSTSSNFKFDITLLEERGVPKWT